jgi:hypothetical protein
MFKKEIISRSKVTAPVAGFPVAARAGHLLFISGRAGLDHRTHLPLAGYSDLGRKPVPALGLLAPDSWEETFVAQAARIYEDLETLLIERAHRSPMCSSTASINGRCEIFRSSRARARRCLRVASRRRARHRKSRGFCIPVRSFISIRLLLFRFPSRH